MAGKKSKSALPKRIAGFKVPKALRKSKTLAALSRNPLAWEITAAGLAAAAAVIMKDDKLKSAVGRAGRVAADGSSQAAQLASRIGHAVAAAITSAAHRGESERESEEGLASTASAGSNTPAKSPAARSGNGPH